MKKVLLILIPSLIVAVIIYVVFQAIIARSSEKGALQVTSSPDSKIYIDGRFIGQTPLCKCDASNMLLTGDYTVRLVPSDSKFSEFQEKISITKSVLTVVDRKFGKDGTSEGSIISLAPLKDMKSAEVLIVSFPDNAQVFLDNNNVGTTPLRLTNVTESDHALKIRKDGYKEKIVRIHTPLGYQLRATIYLGVTNIANPIQSGATPTLAASPSASLTPSVSAGKIIILTTPTGFLRVRDSASLNGAEIGRVTPGQIFPLLSEQPGWYEIQLTDGTKGWISSDYAKKQ